MWLRRAAVVSSFLLILGCTGGVSERTQTVTPPAPTDEIRSVLEDLAKSGDIGMVGSGIDLAREQIEELKKTDATKAEELSKGFDELETLQNKDQVKAKAKELLAKLPASAGQP